MGTVTTRWPRPTAALALSLGVALAQTPVPPATPATATAPAPDLAPAPAPPSGADAARLAAACTGCHGIDGVSAGPAVPTIAGLNSDYFVFLMQGFRDGTRYSTIMGRIARGYTDDALRGRAGFFQDQPFVPAVQKVERALVKQGARLHATYCEKCHPAGGRPLRQETTGRLAGQWRPYLAAAIADFRAYRRPNDERMEARLAAPFANEGEAGIAALLAFYASRAAAPGGHPR